MKSVCSALVVLLVSVASLAAEPPSSLPAEPSQLRYPPLELPLPTPESHRYTLADGTVVFVASDASLPLVDVVLYTRAGAYLEPPGKGGLAALAARTLRRGGTLTAPPAAVEQALDQWGTRLTLGSGGVVSSASLNTLSRHLAPSLELLFGLLATPAFDPAALETERRALGEATARRNDDGAALLEREWAWLLWGREHTAGRETSVAEIAGLGRDELLAFHRQAWRRGNLVIAVAGDVRPAEILPLLEQGLVRLPAGTVPETWPPPPPAARPEAAGRHLLARDLEQSRVAVGWPGAIWQAREGQPDPYALSLLHEILVGGEMTSRLVRRLRNEEGLVYYPGSSDGLDRIWPGSFQVRFQTRPEAVERALAVVEEEVARLRSELVPAEELASARSSLLVRLARGFESRRDLASTFALDELLGRPAGFWQRCRERYAAVTAEQLQAIARTRLSPERRIELIVGRPVPGAKPLPAVDPVTLAVPTAP